MTCAPKCEFLYFYVKCGGIFLHHLLSVGSFPLIRVCVIICYIVLFNKVLSLNAGCSYSSMLSPLATWKQWPKLYICFVSCAAQLNAIETQLAKSTNEKDGYAGLLAIAEDMVRRIQLKHVQITQPPNIVHHAILFQWKKPRLSVRKTPQYCTIYYGIIQQ